MKGLRRDVEWRGQAGGARPTHETVERREATLGEPRQQRLVARHGKENRAGGGEGSQREDRSETIREKREEGGRMGVVVE